MKHRVKDKLIDWIGMWFTGSIEKADRKAEGATEKSPIDNWWRTVDGDSTPAMQKHFNVTGAY